MVFLTPGPFSKMERGGVNTGVKRLYFLENCV
jgi:hypothetical protein